MHTHNERTLTEAVRNTVLPQQVPDAQVLSDAAAWSRHGLPPIGSLLQPSVIAFSEQHDALFFIEVVADGRRLDKQRLEQLRPWASGVKRTLVFVAAFPSRATFIGAMDDTAFGVHVWFVDSPEHSVFLSDSPEASQRYRAARLASAQHAH